MIRISHLVILAIFLSGCQDKSGTDKTDISKQTQTTADSVSLDNDTTASNYTERDTVVPYAYTSYYEFDKDQFPKFDKDNPATIKPNEFLLDLYQGQHAPRGNPEVDSIKTLLPVDINPISTQYFKPLEVLSLLFRARTTRIFSDSGDPTEVIYWNCPSCEKQEILYANHGHWGRQFPGDKSNMTMLTAAYHFTASNKTFKLLSFATYTDGFELDFNGRFIGAIMGLALFEETNGVWNLVDFIPAINSFGSFNSYINPLVRVEHDNIFLIYNTYNGGAGGPYGDSDEILWFNENEKTFKSVAKRDFLSLYNVRFAEWSSYYAFEVSKSSTCPDMIIETSGYYIGKVMDDEDNMYLFDDAPEKFLEACRETDKLEAPFKFTLTRRFSLENNAYVEKEVTLDKSPLIGRWKSRD